MITPFFRVIPAKAGISNAHKGAEGETPAFAGVTINRLAER